MIDKHVITYRGIDNDWDEVGQKYQVHCYETWHDKINLRLERNRKKIFGCKI